MQAVVTEEPPAPVNAGPLGPVITALLRKDPADRPSAAETEQMLLAAMEGHKPRSAQQYVPTERVPEGARFGYAGPDGSTARLPGTAGHPGTAPPRSPHRTIPPRPPPLRGPRLRPHHPARRLPAPYRPRRGRRGGGPRRRSRADRDEVRERRLGHRPHGHARSLREHPRHPGTTPADPTTPAASEIPDGWHRVEDPAGFSLVVPQDWTREVNNGQIDYTPDGGRHRIRISVDPDPDFDHPYLHVRNMEQQLVERLPGYRRIALEKNTFRDRPGALWEFTWNETKDHPAPARHRPDVLRRFRRPRVRPVSDRPAGGVGREPREVRHHAPKLACAGGIGPSGPPPPPHSP